MPKVVAIDNYGRDHVSDQLVAENLSDEDAQALREEHQRLYGGHNAMRYYVVKPDDYKLFVWEP